jgi:hypothetical protein
MSLAHGDSLIRYSIFEVPEECWQYNENACFIGSSEESTQAFLENGLVPPSQCRIEAVTFGDVMNDFGCSSGSYAMERDAFERFKQCAEPNKITFETESYDGDDTLLVVEIDGVARHDD